MQVTDVAQPADMVDVGIEFMVTALGIAAGIVIGQLTHVIQSAVACIAGRTFDITNNADMQRITVFFSIDTKDAQLVLQLPVIVAVDCRQIIGRSIHQRRSAVDTEGFGTADSVQDIIKAAQGVVHQAVADAQFRAPAAYWYFIAQIIVVQVVIGAHPAQKKFIAELAGVIDCGLKAISVAATVFIAIVVCIYNCFKRAVSFDIDHKITGAVGLSCL